MHPWVAATLFAATGCFTQFSLPKDDVEGVEDLTNDSFDPVSQSSPDTQTQDEYEQPESDSFDPDSQSSPDTPTQDEYEQPESDSFDPDSQSSPDTETDIDECPNDNEKSSPGICGCGTPDNDSDNDGTLDCNDDCPSDPFGDSQTRWYPDCDDDGEPSSSVTYACSETGAAALSPCLDGEAPDGGWSSTPGVDCDDENADNPCPCDVPYISGSCGDIPASCSEILLASPEAMDGTYAIDPDGKDGTKPFEVFCDMTSEGGGWTLIAHVKRGPGAPAPGCEVAGGGPNTLGYSIDATGIVFSQIAITHNRLAKGAFASFSLKTQTTFDCFDPDVVFAQSNGRYSILRRRASVIESSKDTPLACFNSTNTICNYQDRNDTFGAVASSIGGCNVLDKGDGQSTTCGAWGLEPEVGDTTWSTFGGRILVR